MKLKMNQEKIKIWENKIDINFKLYFFLKEIYWWYWLTKTQINSLLEIISTNYTSVSNFNNMIEIVETVWAFLYLNLDNIAP